MENISPKPRELTPIPYRCGGCTHLLARVMTAQEVRMSAYTELELETKLAASIQLARKNKRAGRKAYAKQ
jgi:hypothetical protein